MPKCNVCTTKFKATYTFQKVCGDECRKQFYENMKKNILPPKIRKPINHFSKKRTEQNKEYSVLRGLFLLANPTCQIEHERCTHSSTDVHHRMSGADRAKHYLDVNSWMSLCRSCHSYAEQNPNISRENGWIQ